MNPVTDVIRKVEARPLPIQQQEPAAPSQENTEELAGTVKWFDVGKGYGFMVPDSGEADVMVHVTTLRRDGFDSMLEGARIVCEVAKRQRGLQASRVVSMDESSAIQTARDGQSHVKVVAQGGPERATVKWFNRLRGFGFVTRGEGTPDIFVHMEILRQCGLIELRPGDTVMVTSGPGPKGLMAVTIKTAH